MSVPLIRSFVHSTRSRTSRFFKLPDRLKGGSIENAVNYVKNVAHDYKSVVVDTRNDIRARPLRATIIGSCLVSAFYCSRHNPNEDDFLDQLIDSNNKLSRLCESTLNRDAYEHIMNLVSLHNQKVLRYQSFGLFSIIYRAEETQGLDLFEANCKYLKPTWRTYFTERIVDVGFLDQFRVMKHRMIDYDVNGQEWLSQ